MESKISEMPLVRISAPEIFQDADFLRWFVERANVEYDDGEGQPASPIATWHGDAEEPHEYSDFFMTMDIAGPEYNNGRVTADGSNSDMPERIFHQLAEAAWEATGRLDHVSCLVWVDNLAGGEPDPKTRLKNLCRHIASTGLKIYRAVLLEHANNRPAITIEGRAIDPSDLRLFMRWGLRIVRPTIHDTSLCWELLFSAETPVRVATNPQTERTK